MVDVEEIKENIENKKEEAKKDIKEKKEQAKEDLKIKAEETNEKVNEQIGEKINKSKEFADSLGTNLGKTFDNTVIVLKEMQSKLDTKVQSYKESSAVSIPIDLVNAKDYYYIQAALSGVAKEDIELEASETSISITAEFKNIFKNIESNGPQPEHIIKGLKKGKAMRTIHLGNEIKMDEISAKFQDGCLFLEIPKQHVEKRKINID